MLIERAIQSSDVQNINLLQIITGDLSKMIHTANLESPLSVKLFKNMALQIIHLLCLTANKLSEKKGDEEESKGQLNSTDRKS